MLIQTHYLFAEFLFQSLAKKGYAKMICKNSFIAGNIKPDLDLNLRTKDHSIYGSTENISKGLYYLKKYADDQKQFSENLGIVTHYICDSFCAFHNRDHLINDSFVNHIHYELKLHKKFSKKMAKGVPYTLPERSFIFHSDDHIFENLLIMILTDYFSKNAKPSRDTRYALQTSLIFAERMLKAKKRSNQYLSALKEAR